MRTAAMRRAWWGTCLLFALGCTGCAPGKSGDNHGRGPQQGADARKGRLGYSNPGTGTLSVLISTLGESEWTLTADGSEQLTGWSGVQAYSLDVGTGNLTLEAVAALARPCPGGATTDASGRFYLLPDACTNEVTVAHLGLSGQATTDPEWAPSIEEITGSPFVTAEGPLEAKQGNSGRFAYVLNHRGHSISTFRVDPMKGALSLVGVQRFIYYPRAMAMHPAGDRVIVAGGDDGRTVAVLRVDRMTGMLSLAAKLYVHDDVQALRTWKWTDPESERTHTMLGVVTRSAVEVYDVTSAELGPDLRNWVRLPSDDEQVAALAASGFLYVANRESIAAFAIDPATGTLQPVPGAPFRQDTADPYSSYADDGSPSPEGSTAYDDGGGSYASGSGSGDASAQNWPSDIQTPSLSATVGTSGKFLFVGNRNRMTLSAYQIDRTSGELLRLEWSPKRLGARPTSIVAVGGRQQ